MTKTKTKVKKVNIGEKFIELQNEALNQNQWIKSVPYVTLDGRIDSELQVIEINDEVKFKLLAKLEESKNEATK